MSSFIAPSLVPPSPYSSAVENSAITTTPGRRLESTQIKFSPRPPSTATPKNPNVARLMSMRKLNKLSDADILSVAVEASTKKMQGKVDETIAENENTHPNSGIRNNRGRRQSFVSKKLFDVTCVGRHTEADTILNTCNTMSPTANKDESTDKTGSVNGPHIDQFKEIIDGIDASIGESVQEDKRARSIVQETLEQVLHPPVGNNSNLFADGNEIDSYIASNEGEEMAQIASVGELPTPSSSPATPVPVDTPPICEELGEVPATIDSACACDGMTTTTTTNSTARASCRSIHSGGEIRAGVVEHILHTLNYGSYEEMLALKGIGQVRALRILTIRSSSSRTTTTTTTTCSGTTTGTGNGRSSTGTSSGTKDSTNTTTTAAVAAVDLLDDMEEITGSRDDNEKSSKQPHFQSLVDLETIGMSTKIIETFLRQNAAHIVANAI